MINLAADNFLPERFFSSRAKAMPRQSFHGPYLLICSSSTRLPARVGTATGYSYG